MATFNIPSFVVASGESTRGPMNPPNNWKTVQITFDIAQMTAELTVFLERTDDNGDTWKQLAYMVVPVGSKDRAGNPNAGLLVGFGSGIAGNTRIRARFINPGAAWTSAGGSIVSL